MTGKALIDHMQTDHGYVTWCLTRQSGRASTENERQEMTAWLLDQLRALAVRRSERNEVAA